MTPNLRAIRALATLALLGSASALVVACAAIESIGTGGADAGPAPAATDASAEAGITGLGCGIEQTSGATLCRATSACPGLVVDSEAFPRCGFRIAPTGVTLVCACNGAICGMGVFATCAEASKLLSSVTEGEVCVQLGEDRCTTSGTGSSGAPSTCDRKCLSDCGGGAGCADICGC